MFVGFLAELQQQDSISRGQWFISTNSQRDHRALKKRIEWQRNAFAPRNLYYPTSHYKTMDESLRDANKAILAHCNSYSSRSPAQIAIHLRFQSGTGPISSMEEIRNLFFLFLFELGLRE
eukprot:3498892-Rhodomonas_salina.3